MGRAEVEAFLIHLASERNVAASTPRQALPALMFLYREVLGVELPWMMAIGRPETPQCLLEVLTVSEMLRMLSLMHGEHATLAKLLYGTAMTRGWRGWRRWRRSASRAQRKIFVVIAFFMQRPAGGRFGEILWFID